MRPVRVLHVVECMDRAGVETWLMNVLRRIPRQEIAMDFLVHRASPAHFDNEIADLGARRVVCAHPRQPWSYIPRFRQVLTEFGPYDVVHSHVDHFSGAVVRLARHCGVPRRIAHSHNDTRPLQQQSNWLRRRYFHLMNSWIDKYSTHCLAVSRNSAAAMLPANWEFDSRCRLLHYGLDWTPFELAVDPAAVRRELGIPAGAWVVGHVGRMEEQKNHLLLIRLFAKIRAAEPSAHLLLLGDGKVKTGIVDLVASLNLQNFVTFAGVRSDVARILRGAMDVFVFPSRYEGFPLAFLEAQAAGLPCVVSDVVPRESVFTGLHCTRLDLAEPEEHWVQVILEAKRSALPNPSECYQRVSDRLSLESNLQVLRQVYG